TLPSLLPLENYAKQLAAGRLEAPSPAYEADATASGSIDLGTASRTERYLQSIERYFSRYLAWKSRSPTASHRPTKSGGGAGGSRLRPGYVHFGSENDALFELTGEQSHDD